MIVFGNKPDAPMKHDRLEIINMGYISSEQEMAKLYNSADVFLAPSTQESYGYTVAEAIACGTPVVAYNIGGIRDQIVHKKNGYLAKLHDIYDLKQGIEFCIANLNRVVNSLENDYQTVGNAYKQLCLEQQTGVFDISYPKNELLLDVYEKDNYIVQDTGADSDICYIFFSSHGLYYPETEEVFRKEIMENDRYEWKWVARNSSVYERAGRVIFVRDIWKCHYQKGINSLANTLDKTLDLLARLTKGYRVITVGSSAGAYMAVLSGIKLHAEYVFNFSGQWRIDAEIDDTYRDLTVMLDEYDGKIYYFVPAYWEADYKQYLSVRDFKCVYTFLFDGRKHAETMFAGNMCYVVDRDEETLDCYYRKYHKKVVRKLIFLIETVPFLKVIKIMTREIRGFIIRRLGRFWYGT